MHEEYWSRDSSRNYFWKWAVRWHINQDGVRFSRNDFTLDVKIRVFLLWQKIITLSTTTFVLPTLTLFAGKLVILRVDRLPFTYAKWQCKYCCNVRTWVTCNTLYIFNQIYIIKFKRIKLDKFISNNNDMNPIIIRVWWQEKNNKTDFK